MVVLDYFEHFELVEVSQGTGFILSHAKRFCGKISCLAVSSPLDSEGLLCKFRPMLV
jgi:hypothetical protein